MQIHIFMNAPEELCRSFKQKFILFMKAVILHILYISTCFSAFLFIKISEFNELQFISNSFKTTIVLSYLIKFISTTITEFATLRRELKSYT